MTAETAKCDQEFINFFQKLISKIFNNKVTLKDILLELAGWNIREWQDPEFIDTNWRRITHWKLKNLPQCDVSAEYKKFLHDTVLEQHRKQGNTKMTAKQCIKLHIIDLFVANMLPIK